jgi:hypothetical protein
VAQQLTIELSPNPPVPGQPATLTLTSSESRISTLAEFAWTLKDNSTAGLTISETDPGVLSETGDTAHVWTEESDNGLVRVISTPSW